MDIPVLEQLKNYLADRPETAMLAMCVVTIVYLHRGWMSERDAHMQTYVRWMPLAEKMAAMISVMATKTTRSRRDSPPAGTPATK